MLDINTLKITEVVRGEDLRQTTFCQLLIYRALNYRAPTFYHCPLLTDERGVRSAYRHDALALRTLRTAGRTAADVRAAWLTKPQPQEGRY